VFDIREGRITVFTWSQCTKVKMGRPSPTGPSTNWATSCPTRPPLFRMIDRILHHAVVVVTEGESFRMKEAKTRGGDPPKKEG